MPDFDQTQLIVLAALAVVIVLHLVVLARQGSAARVNATSASRIEGIAEVARELPGVLREESRRGREEMRDGLSASQQALDNRLNLAGQSQAEQLARLRSEAIESRTALEASLKRNSDAFAETQTQRLGETNLAMKELAARLEKAHTDARESQGVGLEKIAAQVTALIEANDRKQEAIRETLKVSLEQLRKDNEAKLEQMRVTVDEKLQGTLEARLGESFKLVSERLEQVHKGLGEMQTLATGVGDLKRVLTNVKSRGGWGEVQLGILLEDLLTPDQFVTNARIQPDSGETVEFAVRLPGKDTDMPVLLPIDAKFPQEDYERLLGAHDTGNPDEIEKAGAALERAIRLQAKTICEKYVHPPHSTDFAIMYLPTEGLFAEVIRRPGLCADIQTKHRVMLTGPTTLSALLTSLQMGFRTLAIEKRSSEVWQVLGAAKAEFRKYGDVWDKLGKQLDTARKTVEDAGRRTRAVERRLRDVETLELPGPGMVDELYVTEDEDNAEIEPSIAAQ